jgi:hypothetical protein
MNTVTTILAAVILTQGEGVDYTQMQTVLPIANAALTFALLVCHYVFGEVSAYRARYLVNNAHYLRIDRMEG